MKAALCNETSSKLVERKAEVPYILIPMYIYIYI